MRTAIAGLTATLAATLVGLGSATVANASDNARKACQPDIAAGQTCDRRVVEVMFVLDTTGSMTRLIAGAKQKIWAIANEVADNDADAIVRMGLVGYRDLGDSYVTRFHDLTTDIDGLYGRLLAFQARGGGDTPESVNQALYEAVTRASWTLQGTGQTSAGRKPIRLAFLVGDAPPHMDYQQDVKYPETMVIAKRSGITVNTLQAGRRHDTRRVWNEIARLGGGVFAQIPLSGNVQVIETPYDQDIQRLQRQLDSTIIPYGTQRTRAGYREKLSSRRTATAASTADRAAYYTKQRGKREVVTGGGDLLAELESGAVDLERLDSAKLPKKLRAASPAEQRAVITAKRAERKKIDRELGVLVKQRSAYIAKRKKSAPRPAALDTAIRKSIREAF
ncbi:MAG: vWA domain-containing protein [Pseudomonadota bacterium]